MKKILLFSLGILIFNMIFIELIPNNLLGKGYQNEFILTAGTLDPIQEKEGYQTTYIVIPDSIDISDPDQFAIAGINDSDQVVDETVLEEDVIDGDTRIVLKDNVSGSAPSGFKVVEIKLPVDADETIKFAAAYKFKEEETVSEYVFLMHEDPDEAEAKDNTKSDPFELINPSNYYSYEDFPGIDASKTARYFMVPVRDTSKNYDMEFYSSEVPFKINPDGSIEVLVDFRMQIDILGAEYNGGPVYASAHIKTGSTWETQKTWSSDLRQSGNRVSYTHPTTLPAGTKVGVKTWASGGGSSTVRKESWNSSHVFTENDTRGYIEVHRNGEEIKNIKIAPVDDQTPLEKIVGQLVTTTVDSDGVERSYATIGNEDIIILTEHYGDNPSRSYFDLQDLVALVKLTPVDAGPVHRVTIVHDVGLIPSEDVAMISKASTSNRKRFSGVEFKVIDTGGAEIKFDITNTNE